VCVCVCVCLCMVCLAWYGMVWYGMVWYGMAWYGVAWIDMVWYGMVWCGMDWYGMVWYGMVWYGMVWWEWYGTVWYGMVWYGMVGMVWYRSERRHGQLAPTPRHSTYTWGLAGALEPPPKCSLRSMHQLTRGSSTCPAQPPKPLTGCDEKKMKSYYARARRGLSSIGSTETDAAAATLGC
jgi:chloride channel 2